MSNSQSNKKLCAWFLHFFLLGQNSKNTINDLRRAYNEKLFDLWGTFRGRDFSSLNQSKKEEQSNEFVLQIFLCREKVRKFFVIYVDLRSYKKIVIFESALIVSSFKYFFFANCTLNKAFLLSYLRFCLLEFFSVGWMRKEYEREQSTQLR